MERVWQLVPARTLGVAWLALILASFAVETAAQPANPQDALEAAIASARLDARVFDEVSARGDARVLVVFHRTAGARADAAPEAARARLREARGRHDLRPFQDLPLLAGNADVHALRALVADPAVKSVRLDPIVSAQLSQSGPLVNFDWAYANGFDGSGATVAVLDTGVDLAHPDLAAGIVDEHCFCDDGAPGPFGCCPPNYDTDEQGGPGSAQDDHGHGTRVASVIGSDGVHAALGGAPAAGIVAVKVMDSSGNGFLSDIIQGINWVRLNHPGIEVLNMSLGFGLYPGDCDGADPDVDAVQSAIDPLRATGTLVVAGAGNNRSSTSMIAPACLADVISVGAVWDEDLGSRTHFACTDQTQPDLAACWSNGNASTDLLAPGAQITASSLGGTVNNVVGTSYATPMVSACAALIAHEDPSASLSELEAALEASPVSVVDAKNGLAYPRLDCAASFQALPEPGGTVALASGAVLLAWLRGVRSTGTRRR